tara:strand:- start:5188 stop:6129 length:942 start_codon:yes stop_codon:yes gene_type:complete
MLKKKILTTFLIGLLACNYGNKKSSITKENKFDIIETSEINKIFMADRNGNTITLKKQANHWRVNNRFIVREDAIRTLLSTANKIRIKKPVSRAAFNNVVEYIATTGIYVEFFRNKELVKAYTIGSNTSDHLGTYMLLKESNQPFVIHIPSFNGFLTPRYGIQGSSLNISNWRSNTVFNLSADAIEHIQYTDHTRLENSYILNTNPLELFNSENKSISFNKKKLKKLLNSFQKINCESYKKNNNKFATSNLTEELIINSDTLRIYKISDVVSKSKEENFTVDRKYATLNDGEVMLIQDYVFNKVLININDLLE